MFPEKPAPGATLAVLAALCVLSYLPTLRQPLLEDDYPNLAIAQTYGNPAAWRQLADSVYRPRATSEWLMYGAYSLFGLNPAPYYCVTITLHILCTFLVFALGFWPRVGYRVSAWAAAFFAVYEGHQEAVMWFSACNELLQFLFGVGALVCWLYFLFGDTRREDWYEGALALFVLALISKESAPVFALLAMLPLIDVAPARRRLAILLAVPFWLLAGGAAYWIYTGRYGSFRFQDGSFSLSAPFWRTWPVNLGRLFWFWGLAALLLARRRALTGIAWAAIGLLPYIFLTYSTRIPSRQYYLASAGLALVVGAAMAGLAELRTRRSVIAAVCAVVLAENVGYLWIKKRRQFLERAEPTQELIAFAKKAAGPVVIRCFPRVPLIAKEAAHLGAGRTDVIWDRNNPDGFCYNKEK